MLSPEATSLLIQIVAAGLITGILLLVTYGLLRCYWSGSTRATRMTMITFMLAALALAPFAVDYTVVGLRSSVRAAAGVYIDTGIIALLIPSLIVAYAAFTMNRKHRARSHGA